MKIGYKETYNGIFTYDIGRLECQIGKTYSYMPKQEEMSFNIFDYYETLEDVLDSYDDERDETDNFEVYKVEILGDDIETCNMRRKSTNKFKVLEKVDISKDYIIEKDSSGNIVHLKIFDLEYFKEYDDRNNCIHHVSGCKKHEWWEEYDENNNEIHHRDHSGYERWKKYNNNGQLINYKDNKGNEKIYSYDKDGKVISYESYSEYGIGYEIQIN